MPNWGEGGAESALLMVGNNRPTGAAGQLIGRWCATACPRNSESLRQATFVIPGSRSAVCPLLFLFCYCTVDGFPAATTVVTW